MIPLQSKSNLLANLFAGAAAAGCLRNVQLQRRGAGVAQTAGCEQDGATYHDHNQRADQNAKHTDATAAIVSHESSPVLFLPDKKTHGAENRSHAGVVSIAAASVKQPCIIARIL
jgi:hypothetical protein